MARVTERCAFKCTLHGGGGAEEWAGVGDVNRMATTTATAHIGYYSINRSLIGTHAFSVPC